LREVSRKLGWHLHRALAVLARLTTSGYPLTDLSEAHSLTLSECTQDGERSTRHLSPPDRASPSRKKQCHQFGHLSVCSKGLGPRGGTSLEARNSADWSHGPSPFQKASFLYWPPSLLCSNEYLPA
jgi:hypothetical protein